MRYIYDSQTKSKIPTAGMMNPNIIAPLEPTTVSKRSYLVGDQLIWNDELYTVTQAISVNDALAVGTNITASDSIVEQIAENTSDITSLNEALSNEVEARAALGAHNLFDIETWLNSVNLTYTVNNDVYSTSTGGTSYGTPYIFADKDIDIVISGIITNDTSDNVRFEVLNSSNAVVATIKENTTYASGKGCKVRLNWSTSGDFTIEKPMIRLASDPSSEYTPYAMTNRELTNARFLNGTLGPVVADNFTDKAEYTIPNDGWYYLYLQTNVAASGSTLRIMLGSDYSANSVAHHKNSNIQYESAYANLPLKKGTKVVFKCTDASVSCQYNVTPIT